MNSHRGFAGIGLDSPKNPINVGGALRAAGVYDAAFVATRCRYKKVPTDAMRAHCHLPLLQVSNLRDVIPYDCIPVAVDLVEGATPLPEYVHPERAFYIFGAEDATLGERVLEWCKDVIYIPMSGCMNLAATVNVVLYDRLAKRCKRLQSGPLREGERVYHKDDDLRAEGTVVQAGNVTVCWEGSGFNLDHSSEELRRVGEIA